MNSCLPFTGSFLKCTKWCCARHSAQVSHVAGRIPRTWAVNCCLLGCAATGSQARTRKARIQYCGHCKHSLDLSTKWRDCLGVCEQNLILRHNTWNFHSWFMEDRVPTKFSYHMYSHITILKNKNLKGRSYNFLPTLHCGWEAWHRLPSLRFLNCCLAWILQLPLIPPGAWSYCPPSFRKKVQNS